MAEYIDRGELRKILLNTPGNIDRIDCLAMISAAPTADVAPVRHGEWITENGYCFCSQCESEKPTKAGEFSLKDKEIRYCYFCGAKMDEVI